MADMSESTDHDVRDILDGVAAGRISPQQASDLLAERTGGAHAEHAGHATDADPKEAASATGTDESHESGTGGFELDDRVSRRGPSRPPRTRPSPTFSTTGRLMPEIPAHQEPVVRASNGPTRLRVRAVGRRVRIVGEPFLATVAVEGPHVMRHEGDVLTVASEGEFQATLDNFTLRTPNLRDLQERFVDLTRELVIKRRTPASRSRSR